MRRTLRCCGGLSVLVLLAVVFVLALAACGTTTGTKPLASAGTPQRGGSLDLVLHNPSSLDPAVAGWESLGAQTVFHCVYETLYDYVPAAGQAGTKLLPALAASMPDVSDGGKTYVIPLRRGVRFAPPVNRELTATDVQYSLERMLRTPAAPTDFYTGIVGAADFIAGRGRHVAGLRVVDPYTIEIRLLRPDATLLSALAMEFCDVLPPEWVEKWGKDIGTHPLGTGPFMFDHWNRDVELVLKRNPNYREADRVWLDGVRFELGPLLTERSYMRVVRGQLDLAWLSQADWAAARGNPSVSKMVHAQPILELDYLFLNTQIKPFDDVRVRRAVNCAIDRERLARINGNTAIYQIYPQGIAGHDPKAKFYGYDPAKAKALLAEAGYPQGFATSLYAPGDTYFGFVAEAVQHDLIAAGIRAKLVLLGEGSYWTKISEPRAVPMGPMAWTADYPDPYIYVKAIFSGSNPSFWRDPKLDAMIADAQRTLDPQARIAKYEAMQALIMEQAPIAPLMQPVTAALVGPHVGGFFQHEVYVVDPAHYWRR